MKPINLKEFKEKKEEVKARNEKKSYDEEYEKRFFAMPQRDHDLLNLIHKKLEICREINYFLGEIKDPYDCLTWLELKHYERIHNFLNERS